METIMPITYEDTIIGYMQIGQFKDKEEIYSSEEKAKNSLEKYGFNTAHALDLYKNLPVVSQEKLSALKEILMILIKNFWEEGLIRHNRSMLSIKIDQYIREHVKEKLLVNGLCEQFFISKNRLYEISHQWFKMTISEYITQVRIEEAKKLLTTTDLTVKEVSSAVGINDYNYFTKVFKNNVGIPPLKYKKGYPFNVK
jgi:AraC-like DNA-binding protein